jgi:hypothetical protein
MNKYRKTEDGVGIQMVCRSNAENHEEKGTQANKAHAQQKGRIGQSDRIKAQGYNALQVPHIHQAFTLVASAAGGVSLDASALCSALARSWSQLPF